MAINVTFQTLVQKYIQTSFRESSHFPVTILTVMGWNREDIHDYNCRKDLKDAAHSDSSKYQDHHRLNAQECICGGGGTQWFSLLTTKMCWAPQTSWLGALTLLWYFLKTALISMFLTLLQYGHSPNTMLKLCRLDGKALNHWKGTTNIKS